MTYVQVETRLRNLSDCELIREYSETPLEIELQDRLDVSLERERELAKEVEELHEQIS